IECSTSSSTSPRASPASRICAKSPGSACRSGWKRRRRLMPEFPAALTSLLQRARSPRSPGRRGRAPSLVTALDLDGQTLRVVQAVPRGDQAAVTRVLATQLPLPAEADRADPAVMGRALAEALATLGLKPSSVVMGVPRAQVVLRPLTLP